LRRKCFARLFSLLLSFPNALVLLALRFLSHGLCSSTEVLAAFGASRFIAGAFECHARLSKRSSMIGFQALGGRERRLHTSRRTRRQKRGGDGRIDLLATHLQATNAAPIDHSACPADGGPR